MTQSVLKTLHLSSKCRIWSKNPALQQKFLSLSRNSKKKKTTKKANEVYSNTQNKQINTEYQVLLI